MSATPETLRQALAAIPDSHTGAPLGPEAEAQLAQVTMAKGQLPQGTKLRSLLTKEQAVSYEAAFTKLGLPPQAADQFDAFKPWFAGLNLSMLPLLMTVLLASAAAGFAKRNAAAV